MTPAPPPVPGERTPEEREAARREREARRAARRTGDSDGTPKAAPGRDWLGEARRWLAGDGRGARDDERAREAPRQEAAPPATEAGRSQTRPPTRPAREEAPPAAEPRRAHPPAADPTVAHPPTVDPTVAHPSAAQSTEAREPPFAEPPVAEPTRTQQPPAQPTEAWDATAAEHPVGQPPASERSVGRQAAGPPAQAPPAPPPPRAPEIGPDGTSAARQRRAQTADRLRALSARGPRRPHGHGRLRAGRLVVLATLLVLLGVVGWFLASLFQPFKGDGGQQIRVAVPQGASLDQIAELLEARGVVSSSFFFQTRARLGGRSDDLKPGSYRLREDMSYTAALDALEKGTPPNIVVLTIPEGRSRREVARLVDGQLEGSYMRASRRSPALDPSEYGAANARDLEGFLFPATYELKKGRPMSALVEQQLSAFRQRFEQVDMRYARSKNLTRYDVLIIASLVEREAALAKERPLIASVIYNRLKEGMPLGIDATVRYVTGNWDRPLRQSELASPSPYNTRTTAGLPPGPIGNPGIDSIRAAARPARTNYLFFVVKPGTCGEHSFSATDAEFQRDSARYDAERAERGGRSPTDC